MTGRAGGRDASTDGPGGGVENHDAVGTPHGDRCDARGCDDDALGRIADLYHLSDGPAGRQWRDRRLSRSGPRAGGCDRRWLLSACSQPT